MQLTLSNIAIDIKDLDQLILNIKKSSNYIEISPISICDDFFNNLEVYKNLNTKLQIESIQSIYFKQEQIGIQDETQFKNTLNFMKKLFIWCDDLNISNIVFGNPKMKYFKNEMEKNNIDKFFSKMELMLNDHKVKLLIEPNPCDYGSNYLTNHTEVINYIKTNKFNNVLTMIDCSTLILNKESLDFINIDNISLIKHVHLSAPFLKLNIDDENTYSLFLKVITNLKKCNYTNLLSIEMVKGENYSLEQVVNIYNKVLKMI